MTAMNALFCGTKRNKSGRAKMWDKDKVLCKKEGQDTYYIANYNYICNVDWQHSAPPWGGDPTSHLADSIQFGLGI